MHSGIDIKAFRRALGQFPTGVTVITTLDEHSELIGVTASSFNSVSVDPPLILWSVDRSAHSAAAFEQAEYFVVNVLGKQQVEISNKCASQGEDKFTGMEYRSGRGGCPILNDTAAYFECKTWNLYDGGDHIIIVGQVIEHSYSDTVMPLVFARGSYGISSPQSPANPVCNVKWPDEGFLENYLLYLLHKAYSHYSAEFYPLLTSEFGISPEEWRVLTLLADVSALDINQLAQMVVQPEEECWACVQRLADRGYLVVEQNEKVRINHSGTDMAEQLFSLAKNHEKTVLNTLNDQQQRALTLNLKAIVSAFGSR